ncbi:hypothetical protein Taro_046531 [Colocasia esculenta]|uniref:Kinesin motor domain-containing protein n=1 Tax=Colocasia esculenta TaxID=4460 RepID=A0A843X2H1_COLES|nr:hypothetical protein [Colocasia esculenta]
MRKASRILSPPTYLTLPSTPRKQNEQDTGHASFQHLDPWRDPLVWRPKTGSEHVSDHRRASLSSSLHLPHIPSPSICGNPRELDSAGFLHSDLRELDRQLLPFGGSGVVAPPPAEMSTFSMRSSQRSSISPFRSRKASSSAAAPSAPGKPAGRPTTPSSSSLSSSARPTTPSSLSGRPTTPLSVSRQPNPGRPSPMSPTTPSTSDRSEFSKSKENVTVTVRFRPLSAREINKGDEIAWYADGDYTVRNEYNASVAYSFDRVFGPATTTRHVYDAAAQHVVSGAMQGINGKCLVPLRHSVCIWRYQ